MDGTFSWGTGIATPIHEVGPYDLNNCVPPTVRLTQVEHVYLRLYSNALIPVMICIKVFVRNYLAIPESKHAQYDFLTTNPKKCTDFSYFDKAYTLKFYQCAGGLLKVINNSHMGHTLINFYSKKVLLRQIRGKLKQLSFIRLNFIYLLHNTIQYNIKIFFYYLR